MKEAEVNFESALDKAMAEAAKSGMTAVEVFEVAFGRIVNKSLGLNVSPVPDPRRMRPGPLCG